MTGVQPVTNGVNVSWYGPAGYYQLYYKVGLKSPAWQAAGGFNLTNNATITSLYSNAFFRVLGPTPQYAGVTVCGECHADVHDSILLTPHAAAFTNALFAVQGGQTNSSCLPCHTVGAGLPTGFVNLAATPNLAGVQCENCHGPAAAHAANPGDPTVVPRVELSGAMCGGCHNTQFVPASATPYHPGIYEEWNTSAHRSVVSIVKTLFTTANGPSVYVPSCGRCHSATVREALLDNDPLPDGVEAGAVGIACATCHEPHAQNVFTNVLNGVLPNSPNLPSRVILTNSLLGSVYTNQLRNPFASTNDFFLSTTDVFANKYDPNINLCAQCHNDRGSDWTDTSMAPHPSPQYNMLLGTVGQLVSGLPPNAPGTHSLLEQQCVTCHMQSTAPASPSKPAGAGHTFEVVSYQVCAQCHDSALNASNAVTFLGGVLTTQIQMVQSELDAWATNNAPSYLRTNYATLAWEYTTPGSLSPAGRNGPTTAEQQQWLPATIKKARFNLYLVVNDGSLGVHNPYHALDLLNNASAWVLVTPSN